MISVIMPTYNRGYIIARAIDSVLNQSYSEWELIIIDDCSDDNTNEIVNEYNEKKIKYIRNNERRGACYSRNVGMENACGEYFCFLDSDCTWNEKFLCDRVDAAMKYDADFVYGRHRYVNGDKVIIWPYDEARNLNNIYFVARTLVLRNLIDTNTVLLKRICWEQEGGFDIEFLRLQDWEYFSRILHTGKYKIHFQDNVLVNNYLQKDSISVANKWGIWREKLFEKHIAYCRRENILLRVVAKLYYNPNDFTGNDDYRKHLCALLTKEELCGLIHYMGCMVEEKGMQVPQPPKVQPQKQVGFLVYGVGNHLFDMLDWHPDLGRRIARIFDKDKAKQGTKVAGIGKPVEPPEALKSLPQGTLVAISAIRYLDEITQELHQLNPGLVCEDIDVVYEKLDELLVAPPAPKKQPAKQSVMSGLTGLQKQRLRGREAQARWRQRFLMECVGARRIFWGSLGVRASFLRRKFLPLMGPGDIYIEEDLSRRGQMQDGLPICIPDALKDIKGNVRIIVLSGNYAAVRERLADYGYVENVDFVEGRSLVGEDENGYIDVPCIDKADAGMVVYGLGAHLADMLRWHPELAGKIARVIDKDPKKVGTIVDKAGVQVEPPEVLRDLPTGTEVAVSAIKYLADIKKDIHALQPGLICRDIDKIWQEYV